MQYVLVPMCWGFLTINKSLVLLRMQVGGAKIPYQQDRYLLKNATLKGHNLRNKNLHLLQKYWEFQSAFHFGEFNCFNIAL